PAGPARRGGHRRADRPDDGRQPAAVLLMSSPFETSGISVGDDNIKRYDGLPVNLVEMLRASVAEAPDREAVTDFHVSLTYRELWDASSRVAGGLRGEGVQRGDRVAIRLGNGVDWVLAFFGAVFAGAIAVPVN